MDKIDNLIRAVSDFQNSTDALVIELFQKRERLATSLNVENQLYDSGIDSNGVALSPPYAESTKQRKRRKGQRIDHVTTRDTGDFHDSLLFDYRDTEIAVGSDDPKYIYLTNKYGNQILGLTMENIEVMAMDMKDEFQERFAKAVLQ